MISAIEPMTMKMQIGGKRKKPRKSKKGTKRRHTGSKKRTKRRLRH